MIKTDKAKLCLLITCILFLLGAAPQANAAAKYVFFFIGDGMGAVQRTAAEMYLAGWRSASGDDEERSAQLIMNALPVQGLIRTNSLDGVTDSAAAGTALAAGQKTKNSRIAMDASGNKSPESIASLAKKNGMKVGIVTSAFLQDATPAAFYGHALQRTQHYDIGLQLTESGFDYFAGGGFRNPAGRDKTRRSLLDIAKDKGFRVVGAKAGLASLGPGRPAIAINPKLRAGSMPYVIDRNSDDIHLSNFLDKGVQLLDGERGFFIMVEGGNIDNACHANDAASAIHETAALDEAVGVAMRFYKTRPQETLIVVTADHETGGMKISTPPDENRKFYDALRGQRASYAAFERTVSPGKATYDQLHASARNFFGNHLPSSEATRAAYRMSMLAPKNRPAKEQSYKRLYGPYDPFTMACVREINARAGISWTSFYHSGRPVPISAIGVGSENFSGEYENTEVFSKIRQAMGL